MIYSKIHIKQKQPKYPSFMKGQNAKDLIIHLLAKKPNERGRFNFDKIKQSPFFGDYNWKKLLQE
jgi:hypothetical protein